MICAACGLIRDPADLVAFWPVGRPDERRFVCRVTRPSPVSIESCFRAMVGPASIHEIGPAETRAVTIGEDGPEIIVPSRKGSLVPA